MDLHQIQTVALTATAVGGALGMGYGFLKVAWPRIETRWQNRRSAVMFRTVMSIDAAQKTANTERRQVAHDLADLKKEFVLGFAAVRAVIASDNTLATFDASPEGLLTVPNRTLLNWTGKTQAEIERWGWLNCISPTDRQMVRSEWESAIKDVRQITLTFDMLDAEGQAFKVRLTATPIPEGIIPCEKFVAVMHKV